MDGCAVRPGRRGLPLLLLMPLLVTACSLSDRRPDLRSPSAPAQPRGFLGPAQIDAITGAHRPSPGATSSLAIGDHIAGLATESFDLEISTA